MLDAHNVKLIQLDDLKDFNEDMQVIYPIHMPLSFDEIKSFNPELNYTFKSHHEIIKDLLKDWGEDFPKIEVTGVKGKPQPFLCLRKS